MKVAIVHDHLTCKGGGEQVALTFHKAFPKAPIYTLAYNSEATYPEFKFCDVRTSWFQKITNKESHLKKLFFPLGILAMRSLNLKDYHVILISGTHCAKYTRVNPKALVVTYCYTPFRLAWNPDSYAEYTKSKGGKRMIFDTVVKTLRFFDKRYAQRTNFFLAMTEETKERIQEAYNPKNEVTIINPPVNNLDKYYISELLKEYYLLVSRLETYKKVDLAVMAFNKLQRPLIIVGEGTQENEIKLLVTSDLISFRKNVSTEELAKLYADCRAFIFPQHEDYGLTALEANAAGRPVIAYNKGGIRDTQIPFQNNEATAILFDVQTVDALTEAVMWFEKEEGRFKPKFIKSHAEKFSEQNFIEIIRNFIQQKSLR